MFYDITRDVALLISKADLLLRNGSLIKLSVSLTSLMVKFLCLKFSSLIDKIKQSNPISLCFKLKDPRMASWKKHSFTEAIFCLNGFKTKSPICLHVCIQHSYCHIQILLLLFVLLRIELPCNLSTKAKLRICIFISLPFQSDNRPL